MIIFVKSTLILDHLNINISGDEINGYGQFATQFSKSICFYFERIANENGTHNKRKPCVSIDSNHEELK